MDTVRAILFWLLSWGVIGLCGLAVAGLCWRCGFPFKHRTPPSVDVVVTVVIGTLSGVTGINLLGSARLMNAADAQRVPLIVAGFVLLFVGLKGLQRGFNTATSESPLPPPPKPDDKKES